MRNYIYGHSLRRNVLHILSLQISPILVFLITLPILSKASFHKVKLLNASSAKTLHGGPSVEHGLFHFIDFCMYEG